MPRVTSLRDDKPGVSGTAGLGGDAALAPVERVIKIIAVEINFGARCVSAVMSISRTCYRKILIAVRRPVDWGGCLSN